MKNNFNLSKEICPVCKGKLIIMNEYTHTLYSCSTKESLTLSIHHNHFYFKLDKQTDKVFIIYLQISDQAMIIDNILSVYWVSDREAPSINLTLPTDLTLDLFDPNIFNKLQTLINFS